MAATLEQMRQPDWWTHGKSWYVRYEYLEEWARLLCGTTKRYIWLIQRKRISDDAGEILNC